MKKASITLLLALAACSRAEDHRSSGGPDAAMTSSAIDAATASPNAAVSADNMPKRYRGKPMLVIIESYALATIGELPAQDEARVRAVVQRTFGGGDDWRATVRKTMEWNDSIDQEIRANWDRFREPSRAQNVPADPKSFARAFADKLSK